MTVERAAVGVGALAPVLFGLTLDVSPSAVAWGYAFSALAAGGLVAAACALLLSRSAWQRRSIRRRGVSERGFPRPAFTRSAPNG